MKVLLVCQNIDFQIQFLAYELEKIGLTIEITDDLHPARLVLNRYDLVHFIQNDIRIDLKTSLALFTAKYMGLATVLSVYNPIKLNSLMRQQVKLLDAITTPFISELKKFRFFSGQKMILPFFPELQKNSKLTVAATSGQHENKSFKDKHFIFPIVNSFNELRKINFSLLNTDITSEESKALLYIDAHQLKSSYTSAQIRKMWQDFTKENTEFKKLIIFTEQKTLLDLLKQNNCYTFIYHLTLNSTHIAFWLSTAIQLQNFMILNEDQATGFSDLWNTNHNCFVFSQRLSEATQYDLISHRLQSSPMATIQFSYRQSLDLKLNELARLYTKTISTKKAIPHQNSYEAQDYNSDMNFDYNKG